MLIETPPCKNDHNIDDHILEIRRFWKSKLNPSIMTQEKEKILWGGRFDKSPDELLWVCIFSFEINEKTKHRNTTPR